MIFIQYLVRYPLFALASLLATLIAVFFVNWWAPLFADDQGNLPPWLKWFQTFDASLDAGWQDGYLDPSWGETPFKRYLARVYWLYRNPAQGFDYWPFGLPFDTTQWRVIRYIDTPEQVLFVAIGNGFNIYYHGRFGMAKLGWKAWNYWQGRDWRNTPWGPQWRVPLCCSINPFKRRT